MADDPTPQIPGSNLPPINAPYTGGSATPDPPTPGAFPTPPLNTTVPFVGEQYQLPPQEATRLPGIPKLGSDLLSNTALQTPTQETTSGDLQTLMQPYLTEMANLGPTYGHEMSFLTPYLQPSGAAEAASLGKALSPGVQAPDAALPENQALAGSEAALGNVAASQTSPGFRDLTAANQQYEKSLPYQSILTSMLEAQRNEILYGTTSPNLSNINTKDWPSDLQSVYQYLLKGLNYTPAGVPTPQKAGAGINQAKIESQINQGPFNTGQAGGGNA